MAKVSDIRLDVDELESPAMLRLAAKHGDEGIVSLLRLRCYVAKHFPTTGEVPMGDAEIEAAIRCEPGIVAALEDLGFVSRTDSGIALCNWHETQPWAAGAEKRSQQARENVVSGRWNKKPARKPKATATTTSAPDPRHAQLKAAWLALWAETHGGDVFAWAGKEAGQAAQLLQRGEVSEIIARGRALIADAFWGSKADLGTLVSTWNRWASAKPAPVLAFREADHFPGDGCPDTPPETLDAFDRTAWADRHRKIA